MDQLTSHPLYRKHSMDSAMNSLWEFYKGKFLPLFIMSFVMSLVIQYASTFVNIQELSGMTDPMLILGKMKELIVPILVISAINLLFNLILQYYVIFNPLDRDGNIFSGLAASLRYFIPYVIIMVLLAFAGAVAIALGILVLVVGVFFSVLYIMTLYMLVLPVLIIEGPGIGHVISRTVGLAHRNFWSNLGWVAVFVIILIVLSLILSGIILLPFTGSFIKTIMNPGETSQIVSMASNPIFIVLSALAGALTMPLIPIFSCILYFNGKADEELGAQVAGIEPENTKVRVEDLYARPYSDDHPDNPDNIGK